MSEEVFHVVSTDYTLRAKRRRFILESKNRKRELHTNKVKCLVLNPHGHVSSAVLELAADSEILILVVDDRGGISMMEPCKPQRDVKYLLAQIEALLYRREEFSSIFEEAALVEISNSLRNLGFELSFESRNLRGAEEEYMKILTELFGDEITKLVEAGRARLVAECIYFLWRAGLEPSLGFLHEGPASLARDLSLEFRYNIVDALAIEEMREGPGTLFSLMTRYEKKMREEFVPYPHLKKLVPLRDVIKRQAMTLAASFTSTHVRYMPYSLFRLQEKHAREI